MNSSGIKRGLATAAITALAVTGIPAIANATPLATQADATIGADAVQVLTGANAAGISPKADGTNSTISVAAVGGSNVTSVQFQYQPTAGAAVNIGGPVARNADGLFVVEWDGAAGAGVTTLDLIAIPNTGIANTDSEPTSLVANAAARTVELATEGSRGVFQSPYTVDGSSDFVAVTGTTSNTDSNVTVSSLFSGAPVNAAFTPAPVTGATTGTFAGIIDIEGYPYSADNAANQLALKAATAVGAGQTDDHEASTLYVQQITSVSATATSNNIPTGSNAEITVTVLDQNGKPIPNVLVNYNTPDTSADGDTDPQPSGVSPSTVRTDATGKATYTTLGAGSYTFFAEEDAAAAGVQNPGEKASVPVVITAFTPALAEVRIVNERTRANFDLDELADGDDFTIETRDQNGGLFNETLAGNDVEYRYIIDPSGAGATVTTEWRGDSAETTPAGTYTVPAPTAADLSTIAAGDTVSVTLEARRPNDNGTGLRNATPVTVKAGESDIVFANGDTASAPANGSYTATGTLQLSDGSALAGREATVTYVPTGDSALAPTAQQPAGVTVAGNTATVVTDANGKFSVVVTDPTVPANVTPVSETGTITADGVEETATDSTALYNPGYALVDPATINAGGNAKQQQTVTFSVSTPPANSKIVIDTESGARPGEVVNSGITVTSGAGNTAVAGLSVTLTVDHGFFTDGTLDPAPAVGADAAEFKSLGTSITVTTDGNGRALFSTAIERDAGFDDDGLVKAIVTATAGTVTDTEDVDYNSTNPLNGGSVKLVESPAAEQSGPTDPAAVGQSVLFDLVTTDQFGNRVGGEFVNVTENKPGAETTSGFSDFDDSGDIRVTSDRAQTVTATASWTTDTYRYTTATGNGAPATVINGETLTGTADVVFEGIDFEGSDFSISSNPEGTVTPGTAVTETVTVLDQNGNPAQGLQVEFVRSGAGGGETESRTTNANGEANYTFVASTEGTVNITAIVSDGEGQTETLTDTVTVDDGTTPPPTPVAIVAKLSGESNGAAKDKLTVSAPAIAAGAEVRLFKVINGKRIQVGNTKGLNAQGDATFIVKDTNKNRLTKYVAVVVKTSRTLSDTTNPKRVR